MISLATIVAILFVIEGCGMGPMYGVWDDGVPIYVGVCIWICRSVGMGSRVNGR